ncbi:hypothetical protein LA080_003889 [Diaporthe eres]|nr:hypothetical protein LA080_003889 [Diaporthe eres]
MPSIAVQTDTAPGQRLGRPCRMCQMQLRLQRLYAANGLSNIWIRGRWAWTTRNTGFWYFVSVAVVAGLCFLSDDPYYCGEGRQGIRGRHVWEREAAMVTDIMEYAGDGARRLAGWVWERNPFLRLVDNIEEFLDNTLAEVPEVKPEPEGKSVVKPSKTEANAEPEADDGFDLCEVE